MKPAENLNEQRKSPVLEEAMETNVSILRNEESHSTYLPRRSTFSVIAQGLHLIRRKAPLHKLDEHARIGFPLLFILCNGIYWFILVVYTA